MFKLEQSNSFLWPVKISYPIDGGRSEEESFDVEFKRLPQSRLDAIPKDIANGDLTDKKLVREIVVGWKGVVNNDGKEVPFTASTLEVALENSGVASAIVNAWFESQADGKRKN